MFWFAVHTLHMPNVISTAGALELCSKTMLSRDNLRGLLHNHGDCLKLRHYSRLGQLLSITASINKQ